MAIILPFFHFKFTQEYSLKVGNTAKGPSPAYCSLRNEMKRNDKNEKNKEQIWPRAVRPKIIILRAVIQSWNFADFDLYIGGETGKQRNLGFRQCKTIIMPPIPISYSSVSCCRRCLRCAKRCSFCLLLHCSR